MMQKKILAAAVAALCGVTGTAMAQQSGASKVELWGIVDAAVRHTSNGGKTQMVGGGMSQGRWGIKVEEDLGGGAKAFVELENRFNTDDGSVSTPFFQLSYVGLQGKYGRLSMGRQWNVLFDVVSSTYASFPYSTYMDAFKPELGMAVGARTSNALKYTLATPDRKWVASAQYSFAEGNTNTTSVENAVVASLPGSLPAATPLKMVPQALQQTLINNLRYPVAPNPNMTALVTPIASGALKTMGGFLRYSANGISLGGGFLRTELPGGTDLDAWTVGGSYRSGKLYANLGYGHNKIKEKKFNGSTAGDLARYEARRIIDRAVINGFWQGQTNGGFISGDANKRQMIKLGFGYQVTPQINIGAHYYHAKQSGSENGRFNGKSNMMVAAIDYAFSKRTDAYFGVDHTKISGGAGMSIDAGERRTKRTGFTVGLRHRF